MWSVKILQSAAWKIKFHLRFLMLPRVWVFFFCGEWGFLLFLVEFYPHCFVSLPSPMKVNGLQRAWQFSHKKRRKTMNSFRWDIDGVNGWSFALKNRVRQLLALNMALKVKKGPLLKRGRWLLRVSRSIRGLVLSIDKGKAEIDGEEFESEDLHTTVGADMPCWKVFDEKSRLNGGVVWRRYTSHSKTL